MPTPFPGMDPYLESPAYWLGFHTTFLVYLRKEITALLPVGYYAEVEQHVWLEGDDNEDREAFAYPDAFVAVGGEGSAVSGTTTPTMPTCEVTFAKPTKKKETKYIKIVDASHNRLVTVVELLSPANKTAGPGRLSYLAKRDEYILTGTHLVEIDLLRDGDRLPLGRPRLQQADYYAFVSRAEQYPRVAVWAFTVRDTLPILPIPLKPEHGDLPVPLRACLDNSYSDAGYQNRIDYSLPPDTPLRKSDSVWASKLLKSQQ